MVYDMVHQCGPRLYILRGLPGSGRRKLAKKLNKSEGGTGVILRSFDYFRDENGAVRFDRRKLNAAHSENRIKAKQAMEDGEHPVIIDNTNIYRSSMKPYVEMGQRYGYEIILKFAHNSWELSTEELHRRTGKNVPLDVIERMKRNYEFVDGVDDILNDHTDQRKKKNSAK